MRLIVLLALCIAAVAAVPADPQRIVGGSVTTIQQYPQNAALLYAPNAASFRQSCGGIIINNRSILTAAHCTHRDRTVNRWRVRVGSSFANSGGVVHTTNRITNHPNYNARTNDNDVGVFRLNSNIGFNNAVQRASIAGANYHLGDNQVVWATGWGRTSWGGPASEQLRHVQIWTVNQNVCRQRYAEKRRTITDNMLCAGWLDVGGRDQCQGDSGGPLYHNRVVVGVTSFGEECARPRWPGVNARVSRLSNWIQANA